MRPMWTPVPDFDLMLQTGTLLSQCSLGEVQNKPPPAPPAAWTSPSCLVSLGSGVRAPAPPSERPRFLSRVKGQHHDHRVGARDSASKEVGREGAGPLPSWPSKAWLPEGPAERGLPAGPGEVMGRFSWLRVPGWGLGRPLRAGPPGRPLRPSWVLPLPQQSLPETPSSPSLYALGCTQQTCSQCSWYGLTAIVSDNLVTF